MHNVLVYRIMQLTVGVVLAAPYRPPALDPLTVEPKFFRSVIMHVDKLLESPFPMKLVLRDRDELTSVRKQTHPHTHIYTPVRPRCPPPCRLRRSSTRSTSTLSGAPSSFWRLTDRTSGYDCSSGSPRSGRPFLAFAATYVSLSFTSVRSCINFVQRTKSARSSPPAARKT
ncbi:hypothetical protein F4680DRAFT_411143 [Xylaria scruposa]|nr:hypothetical protein F4680DRAFT_411143 [Xylaria scruposa]